MPWALALNADALSCLGVLIAHAEDEEVSRLGIARDPADPLGGVARKLGAARQSNGTQRGQRIPDGKKRRSVGPGAERRRELAHAVAEASGHLESEHRHLAVEGVDQRFLDALLRFGETLRVDAF